jgi:two-component system, OmpR family, response regulator
MQSPAAARTIPHVLIVDDDPMLGELLVEVAQSVGYRCTLAATRAECMRALGPDIILILLDLTLPDTEGSEALRVLGDQGYAGQVALMSGGDQRVLDTAAALGTGLGLRVLRSLQKPFHLAELQAFLQSYLTNHRARGGRPGED